MSTNLYYRPVVEQDGEDLSYELKKAISQKYWDHDGSCGGTWVPLDYEDISFLEGVLAGGIKDAKILIKAIDKYGVVEIALIG